MIPSRRMTRENHEKVKYMTDPNYARENCSRKMLPIREKQQTKCSSKWCVHIPTLPIRRRNPEAYFSWHAHTDGHQGCTRCSHARKWAACRTWCKHLRAKVRRWLGHLVGNEKHLRQAARWLHWQNLSLYEPFPCWTSSGKCVNHYQVAVRLGCDHSIVIA